MALKIEDYALISDCFTGALVGSDGSIDWLCLPRYESASVLGALLGDADQGRWLLRPESADATSTRSYLKDTFTLITTWTTPDGEVEVTDLMPRLDGRARVIRRVRGLRGTVTMRQEVRIPFDYATATPWVTKDLSTGHPILIAMAGPDSIAIHGPELHADGLSHPGTFNASKGDTVDLSLTWFPSHENAPAAPDVTEQLDATAHWWGKWAELNTHDGPDRDAVHRSLLVLRALTHTRTSGIVAAATTSGLLHG